MKKRIEIHNVGWIISAAAFIMLMAVSNIEGILTAMLCMLAVGIAGMLFPHIGQYFRTKNKKADILAVLVCTLAGVNFYSMWQPSSMMAGLARRMGMGKNNLLVLLAACAGVAAYYAVRSVIGAWPKARKVIRKKVSPSVALPDVEYKLGRRECLFLFAVAAAAITICSKSSPIYPFNDWVDSNCFFTVGKSMLHGKVLYRDIYEQKGILLYAIHALAYLISNTSFFGVYLLEIAAAFAFLVLAYKTALLFCSDTNTLYIMPCFAAMVYGAQAFCHGDSAEEFGLPLLAYALWVGMKAIKRGKLPNKKEYIWIGVTSGCILWIKYTMLGFYLGWYMLFFCIMAKAQDWKGIACSLKMIGVGVFAVTIPILLYFGVNGALGDLGTVYFYNNMFLYRESEAIVNKAGVLGNVIAGVKAAIHQDKGLGIVLLLALLWHYIVEDSRVVKLLIFSILSTALLVFVGDVSHIYYALVFAVFAVAALPALTFFCLKTRISLRLLAVSGMILAILLSNNTYMLKYSKEDLPQYAFKKIIEQVLQPSLLNYGFLDGGFYTVCDIVPENKYFCTVNMPLKESDQEQDYYIEQGITDFVVTRNREIKAERYKCVAEKEFEFENRLWKYRLYALKELNLQ